MVDVLSSASSSPERSFSFDDQVDKEEDKDDGTYKPKYYSNTDKQKDVELTKADLARQRWKIFCLVKTADAETDEIVRQERLKERVDEWMAGFVNKYEKHI